ncbi:MAG: hypothetical protein HY674_06540 [Chloroflexi bacterium]|nr:hypothetical protein [Chloroflexota bacterium]
MQVHSFIAESAPDAVAQIRAHLGPEAVVLNVRRLAGEGLARLWQRPRIEVLAYKPDAPAANGAAAPSGLAELRQELAQIREQFRLENRQRWTEDRSLGSTAGDSVGGPARHVRQDKSGGNGWRMIEVLEAGGFLPLHAQRVADSLRTQHGLHPPAALAEEVLLTRRLLAQLWRKPPPLLENSLRPHVFIGPAGVGKTTCLCKWLTQAVLVEGRSARVWRLDGATANAAESLAVYCEILGVPLERSWHIEAEPLESAISFIDLPGVNWRDSGALQELKQQLKRYLSPQVHLVLNSAYDVSLLMAQARAFAGLPVEDLILTHLDEEMHWGKMWNLVLGTNYSIRFLSAGQNIPGDFCPATPEKLFVRQFPA